MKLLKRWRSRKPRYLADKFRLVIHHPLDDNHHLVVSGNFPDRQDPYLEMIQGETRPLAGQVGEARCWEIIFDNPEKPLDLEYCYGTRQRDTGAIEWEREPKRRLELPMAAESENQTLDILDINYVARGMQITPLTDYLLIGPYPQLADDIRQLQRSGIQAVVNLQTDEDFDARGIDWPVVNRLYEKAGIECLRLPILDFDGEDLEKLLPDAINALDKLQKAGKVTYIHCTAGIGRAPALAIAWLARDKQQTVDTITDYVKGRRPIITPNMSVLKRINGES